MSKVLCLVYEKRFAIDPLRSRTMLYTSIYYEKYKLLIRFTEDSKYVEAIFQSDTDGTEETTITYSGSLSKGENLRYVEISSDFLDACLKRYKSDTLVNKYLKEVKNQLQME